MTVLPAACTDRPNSPAVRPRLIRVTHVRRFSAGFTPHGRVATRTTGSVVEIEHRFVAAIVSDSLIVDSLSSLVSAGILSGQAEFEEAAVGIITTTCADERFGWRAFYANSVAELRFGHCEFSPVHRRARSLLVGDSVLEVGCCFGFLALQCALDGYRVSACDITAGAIDLLRSASADLCAPVDACVSDARRLDLPDSSVDTVTLIHLLEHLDATDIAAAITEAIRVARQRVVIAVPFEDEPSAHFGHLQRLTESDLHAWSIYADRHPTTVFTDHGGWLVIDLDQHWSPT